MELRHGLLDLTALRVVYGYQVGNRERVALLQFSGTGTSNVDWIQEASRVGKEGAIEGRAALWRLNATIHQYIVVVGNETETKLVSSEREPPKFNSEFPFVLGAITMHQHHGTTCTVTVVMVIRRTHEVVVGVHEQHSITQEGLCAVSHLPRIRVHMSPFTRSSASVSGES